jgi:hypothetical protein
LEGRKIEEKEGERKMPAVHIGCGGRGVLISIRIVHVCDDFAVQVSWVFNCSRSSFSFSRSGENENDYENENEPDLRPSVAAAAVGRMRARLGLG